MGYFDRDTLRESARARELIPWYWWLDNTTSLVHESLITIAVSCRDEADSFHGAIDSIELVVVSRWSGRRYLGSRAATSLRAPAPTTTRCHTIVRVPVMLLDAWSVYDDGWLGGWVVE